MRSESNACAIAARTEIHTEIHASGIDDDMARSLHCPADMDREFTSEQRHARRWSVVRRVLPLVLVVGVAGWTGQRYLRPSLDLKDVRIETVERGPLLATITAQGTVVPREAQTIASPVSAEVRAVSVALGEHVARGQIIMQLDTTASKLELGNLDERLALNGAERRSQDLQLNDAIRQARSRRELRAIDLESRATRYSRLEKLAGDGIVSATELLEARLDVKRTRVELEQTDAEIVSLAARREAEIERLELEHSILAAQRAEQARRVELSSVKATLDGIVTALVQDAGSLVTIGTPLATIAAQEAFSVEAAVSDYYAPQLAIGQRVRVRAATREIGGQLGRILPDAEGSRLLLFITFDDAAAPGFHANLRIEADIVLAEKTDVLQVRRGTALDDGGVRHLFVIADDRAVRRPVQLGLRSSQQVEIVAGLAAGDRVIVSDMSGYENISSIRIH